MGCEAAPLRGDGRRGDGDAGSASVRPAVDAVVPMSGRRGGLEDESGCGAAGVAAAESDRAHVPAAAAVAPASTRPPTTSGHGSLPLEPRPRHPLASAATAAR